MAKLDINSASLEELTGVEGIGAARAQAIVTHRNSVGEFRSLDELLKVPHFDDITRPDFEALKERLEIRSETIERVRGHGKRSAF